MIFCVFSSCPCFCQLVLEQHCWSTHTAPVPAGVLIASSGDPYRRSCCFPLELILLLSELTVFKTLSRFSSFLFLPSAFIFITGKSFCHIHWPQLPTSLHTGTFTCLLFCDCVDCSCSSYPLAGAEIPHLQLVEDPDQALLPSLLSISFPIY